MRRLLSLCSGIALLAVAIPMHAQLGIDESYPYGDIAQNAWYVNDVQDFLDRGYLDRTQSSFRPGELATRAEFAKLLIEVQGGMLVHVAPHMQHFDDVSTSAWYFDYMEDAAERGWVHGDNNCYGERPCYARPNDRLMRAEAAALIVRSFEFEGTGNAPDFTDNPGGQWFTNYVRIAADHCVLRGDSGSLRIRPTVSMNRAEMVSMLNRARIDNHYNDGCNDEETINLSDVFTVRATANNEIELSFDDDTYDFNSALLDPETYTVSLSGATVTSARLYNGNTVRLSLSGGLLRSGTDYRVYVGGIDVTGHNSVSGSLGFRYTPSSQPTLSVSASGASLVNRTPIAGQSGATVFSLALTAGCDQDAHVYSLRLQNMFTSTGAVSSSSSSSTTSSSSSSSSTSSSSSSSSTGSSVSSSSSSTTSSSSSSSSFMASGYMNLSATVSGQAVTPTVALTSNTNGAATLQFNGSNGLTIPKCTTRVVTIRASLPSGTPTGWSSGMPWWMETFSLQSSADIQSDATVTTSFPVTGPSINLPH